MKKKPVNTVFVSALFLMMGVCFSCNGRVYAYVSFAPGVASEMYKPEYWILQYSDPNDVLKTDKDIEQLNLRIMNSSETLVNNVWDEQKYGELQRNRIRYGICVKRTDIKSEPVAETVWDNPADPYFDRYQLTAAGVNTPVLIDNETEDGMFYHVITYDYEGWTLTENVAVCADRQEWMRAQEMEHILMVCAPRIYLEISRELLTMGTGLRLLTQQEAGECMAQANTWGCYVVEVPIRRTDGSYGVRYDTISITERVNVGYLPFTTKNLIEQMFLFLGERYGWGGMYESVDCSGLVQEVMACFGIKMPRDAREQIRIPASRITFTEDMTEDERKGTLDLMPPGTLLYFPGHIMIYLGQVQGEYYVISSVSSMKMPQSSESEDALKVRRVVINTLSMERKSSVTWLNALQYAVCL